MMEPSRMEPSRMEPSRMEPYQITEPSPIIEVQTTSSVCMEEVAKQISEDIECTEDIDTSEQFVLVNESVLEKVDSSIDEDGDDLNEILYKDDELEIYFVSETAGVERIGSGSRCTQFSFLDGVTGEYTVFPPVFISETEVEHLINIVQERADRFKAKSHKVQPSLGKRINIL